MSVKSSNSNPGSATVVRAGYLKKLKTFKKKYFVLRAEGPESSARLEYYDSEKKFNNGLPPKRSIPLKTCFNINKRVDTKHKHVIALYTKDDCFCLVLESEDELEAWLKALLSLQHGEEAADGETPRPTFGKRLRRISSSRSDRNTHSMAQAMRTFKASTTCFHKTIFGKLCFLSAVLDCAQFLRAHPRTSFGQSN
ncbi:insulin receptor substrate 1-like [Photinus pyralis]|uniref:insulin receptor substrate 1-like n=1 Tax=Photinus pyralis TaxID=7054 RepID=UPI001267698D|nr:insulin receptor substrate 1-like [Photinus pyralis]